jgi:CubicO group peptidase (beta-lactamase class C family)
MASITKPIATASAIMKLVEQGKIKLTESVSKYLPEWNPSAEEKTRQEEITRAKKLIKLGGVKLSDTALKIEDVKTTPVPGQKPPKETAAVLWRRLIHEGKIKPSDKYFEDLVDFGPDRQDVTLRHLLTHTAGLDPFDVYQLRFPEGNARKKIIADIGQRKLAQEPGQKFVYSDLGFITLAEVVERVSGTDINTFCKREVFGPLGMNDTMYVPPRELMGRIAPTEWRTTPTAMAENPNSTKGVKPDAPKAMIRGDVHDGNAWLQNGLSGHAGLFSTAHDLAIYCQMMLNGGEYDGKRIFGPLTVRAMTRDESRLQSGDQRGYGWDIKTAYSGQRGDIFANGFGHTGWTIWVVPDEELFIIILTNRVHPDGKGDAGPLRSRIANVTAASIVKPLSNGSPK